MAKAWRWQKKIYQAHFRNNTHSANSLIIDEAFKTLNLQLNQPRCFISTTLCLGMAWWSWGWSAGSCSSTPPSSHSSTTQRRWQILNQQRNNETLLHRVASIIRFSAFTRFGSLPAPPSSSLATTLLPSGSGRRWTIHVGKYQNALCIFTCLKESFAWRIESSHDKEIQHDKWRLWSNCGGH